MEHQPTGIRYRVQVVCSKCGNNTFTASKITRPYPGREEAVFAGVLAHDGFGWEISDMDIACAVCGGEPKADIQPMPNGDAQGPDGEGPEGDAEEEQ